MPIKWTERQAQVSDLKPYERNPRRISEAAFNHLKASLQEMGYHQRILAQPDLRVIGGHQRIKALKEIGIETITVLVPDRELSLEEFKRLLIQDNLPFGEFNWEMLKTDFGFGALKDWCMPVDWLKKVNRDFDDSAAENVPEAQVNVVSEAGNIWQLGGHRLLCGDSTKHDAVARLLAGEKPNLMVTDPPPYGVEYDPEWRNRAQLEDGTMVPARAVGTVTNDDRADWREAWALFPGNIAYVWHAGLFSHTVAESLMATKFKLRSQIIWAKSNFAIGRGDYHWQHEPCWYAVREKGNWQSDRSQTTLWAIDKPQKSETGHSTQKPIECMRRPMLHASAEGDIVYDPFLGSGTTLIAAQQSGRRCYGIEIAPQYVDLICRRFRQLTGIEPLLEGTNITFTDAEKSRG